MPGSKGQVFYELHILLLQESTSIVSGQLHMKRTKPGKGPHVV